MKRIKREEEREDEGHIVREKGERNAGEEEKQQ